MSNNTSVREATHRLTWPQLDAFLAANGLELGLQSAVHVASDPSAIVGRVTAAVGNNRFPTRFLSPSHYLNRFTDSSDLIRLDDYCRTGFFFNGFFGSFQIGAKQVIADNNRALHFSR